MSGKAKSVSLGGDTLYADDVTISDAGSVDASWLRIKDGLTAVYRYCSIYIFVAGFTAFLVACVTLAFRKASIDPLITLSASLWALYLSRLALLVLIDTTSFPGVLPRHLKPILPIWSAAAIISVAALWRQFVSAKRTRVRP